MVLEQARKYRKEAQQKEAQRRGLPASLIDILQNPQTSEQFGMLVERIEDEATRERIAGTLLGIGKEGELPVLEEGDLRTLIELGRRYSEIKGNVENLVGNINLEMIREVAAADPDGFGSIVNLLSPEGVLSILKDPDILFRFAVENGETFENVLRAVSVLSSASERGRIVEIERTIKERLRQYGISEEKFAKIISLEGEIDVQRTLADLLKERMKLPGKILDLISGGQFSLDLAQELLTVEIVDEQGRKQTQSVIELFNKYLKNIEEYQRQIAQNLGALFSSQAGREIITEILRGAVTGRQQPERTPTASLRDLGSQLANVNVKDLSGEYKKWWEKEFLAGKKHVSGELEPKKAKEIFIRDLLGLKGDDFWTRVAIKILGALI